MKTEDIEVVGDSFTQADRLADKEVEKFLGEVKGSRSTYVREDLKHIVSCEVEVEG